MSELLVTRRAGVAALELHRPRVFNALSPALLEALIAECAALAGDPSVRVVVLRGAGAHFSAGADLPAFNERLATAPELTADLGRVAAEALAGLPQITLAAVRGHCIGGAIVLAGACDLRVAADDSSFSLPEVDAGIPLAWGGMPMLIRLVGESLATDLVLTCRRIDAGEALAAGLVSRVVTGAQFDSTVGELAAGIAGKAARVLRLCKQQLAAIRDGSFDARDDAAALLDAMSDDESREKAKQYLEARLGRS